MEKVDFVVKKEGGFNVACDSRLTFSALGILRALDISFACNNMNLSNPNIANLIMLKNALEKVLKLHFKIESHHNVLRKNVNRDRFQNFPKRFACLKNEK